MGISQLGGQGIRRQSVAPNRRLWQCYTPKNRYMCSRNLRKEEIGGGFQVIEMAGVGAGVARVP